MRAKLTAALLAVTIIFQHFQIALVGGYAVTIGFIAGLLVVLLVTVTYPLVRVAGVWALVLGVSALAAITAGASNAGEYFGTLVLFLVTIAVVMSASGRFDREIVRSEAFARSILLSLGVIVVLSVGQVALGKTGSSLLFNPFGRFQYQHEYDPQLGFVEYPRAHGFFLEPSYDAFVIGALTVALICLGKYRRSAVVLGVAGVLACQSATGLLLLAFILVLIAFRTRTFAGVAAIVIGFAVLVYSGDYLVIRLATLDTAGSSANYRLFAPLPILSDVLSMNPFGMPLGSVTDVMYSYGLQMAGIRASSLDNGFYVVVFYFGWFGVAALVALAVSSSYFALNAARQYATLAWIAPLWIFGSMFFSGGIMAPEFGLMTWLVLVSFRLARITEKVEHGSPPNTPEHRRGDLQGSRRT